MKLDRRSLAKSSQTCTSLRRTELSGAQAGPAANSLLSGIGEGAVAKHHRTVRWANRARANGRQCDQWATRGPSQRSLGHTGLSSVNRTVSGAPRGPKAQRSASPEKEINRALFMSGGSPDCLVRQPTEGKNCLPNGDPTTPSCLGL
jgi:hypothetical protein